MKKYEEQIINYLVGGTLGLIFLIPFMCPYINFIYNRLSSNDISYLAIGSLCMLSVFLLFTIASGVTSYKANEKNATVLPSLILYFKTTPFIVFFLFVNILIGFHLSILLSIIISLGLALIDYLFVRKLYK